MISANQESPVMNTFSSWMMRGKLQTKAESPQSIADDNSLGAQTITNKSHSRSRTIGEFPKELSDLKPESDAFRYQVELKSCKEKLSIMREELQRCMVEVVRLKPFEAEAVSLTAEKSELTSELQGYSNCKRELRDCQYLLQKEKQKNSMLEKENTSLKAQTALLRAELDLAESKQYDINTMEQVITRLQKDVEFADVKDTEISLLKSKIAGLNAQLNLFRTEIERLMQVQEVSPIGEAREIEAFKTEASIIFEHFDQGIIPNRKFTVRQIELCELKPEIEKILDIVTDSCAAIAMSTALSKDVERLNSEIDLYKKKLSIEQEETSRLTEVKWAYVALKESHDRLVKDKSDTNITSTAEYKKIKQEYLEEKSVRSEVQMELSAVRTDYEKLQHELISSKAEVGQLQETLRLVVGQSKLKKLSAK